MAESTKKPFLNDTAKRALKVGGILCAICTVSALAIAGVNALTAGKIEQNKQDAIVAGYRKVFSNTAAVSDSVSSSGTYVTSYVVAYSDSGKTAVIGNIYSAYVKNGYGSADLLIGISGTTDAPAIGTVYLVTNGFSYGQILADSYVDPLNAASDKDTALANVKCGATTAATLVQKAVKEAKSLYSSATGEDLNGEIKSIYEGMASYDNLAEITGASYAKGYYGVYSDSAKTTYLGSVYRLSGSTNFEAADGNSHTANITLLAGVSGSIGATAYGKIAIVKDDSEVSFADYVTSYNAAPSEATLAPLAGATYSTALIQKMVKEAVSLYESGIGNLSADGNYLQIYSGIKALSDETALSGKSYVQSYRIAYSDVAKSTELGYIFKAQGSTGFDTETGESHTATISLLAGMSGSASAVSYGKMLILSDNSEVTFADYVTTYNSTPSEANLAPYAGATYSTTLIKNMVGEAKSSFVTLKGGN